MPNFFDIHSHIHFPEYDADRTQVLARMKEKNVWTITIGSDLVTSRNAVELADKNEGVFASIGIHPVDDSVPGVISAVPAFDEKAFAELVSHTKVVAIGECGLDYGRSGVVDDSGRMTQKKNFEMQIDFAVKHNKPLMLHVRNAHNDVLDILTSKKRGYGERLRGNVHFFSGNVEIEKKYLDLGFSVSFTGVITFVNDYDEAVKCAPLDMIMTETDAPFVAPIPYRGKRNEPAYVEQVVKKMAQIKGISIEEMQKTLVNNAIRIFNIPL
jgi:TatD DNase family protein